MFRRFFRYGLACLFVISLVVPLSARQWNATPTALAMDYVQIIDQRSQNEIVMLMWMAPPLLPDHPQNKEAREIVKQFIVLGVVHAKISNLGKFSFKDLPPPQMRVSATSYVEAIEVTSLPPVIVGVITTLQAVLRQNLGPMGKGIKWFVYDGKSVESCGRGRFWVKVTGTEYDYVTPIPGCPKIPSALQPS